MEARGWSMQLQKRDRAHACTITTPSGSVVSEGRSVEEAFARAVAFLAYAPFRQAPPDTKDIERCSL
jgi:hypothetical protein